MRVSCAAFKMHTDIWKAHSPFIIFSVWPLIFVVSAAERLKT